MTPSAGTAVTSDRSLWALAGSPVARSTVGSGDISVEIGFIATRTTTGSPVVIPPSSPPALLVGRRNPPRGSPRSAAALPARPPRYRIVHLRPGPPRRLDAHPDLHRLYRRDRHQQAGQPAVELPVPAHVAAEPDDDPAGDDLDLAAQRVAGLLGLVDPAHDLGLDRPVEHPDLGAVGGVVERHGQLGGPGTGDAAERDDVAADLDAELVEQPLGQGAGGDPRGGLPGAGALQDVAGVEPVVLEHAGQVGVARPGAGDPPAAQLARRRRPRGP